MTNSIDLSNLHKKGSRINWEKSVGDVFTCIYNNKEYDFIIKDYMHTGNPYVHIYNSDEYQGWIFTSDLKKCKLGRILKSLNKEYYYDLNEVVDNIQIIARRRNPKTGTKEYQIKCLLCGYDMSKHTAYRNKKLFKNKWRLENNIVQGKRCPCCCEPSQITVPGINDIPTTAPWMIPYFQGGYDEAKMYTKRSSKYIKPRCPDCGRIKKASVSISNLYHDHSIGCICSDHISYPNKFSYALLEQFSIKNWKPEYKPKWAKPYRYDNYFEYNKKKYILEMDGALGHGKNNKNFSVDEINKQIEIDNLKDDLAKKHNIKVIRIDCIKSDLEYIKNNIINSELNNVFNLSKVDWEKCDKSAISNLHKKICYDWEFNKERKDLLSFLCNKYGYSKGGINGVLKKGVKYNWCSYNPDEEQIKNGNRLAKVQSLKYQKYITCYNINTNKKIICYANYSQIAEMFNIKSNGSYIGVMIENDTTSKNGDKFYLSTKEEIEYFKNNNTICKTVRNINCYYLPLN